MWAGGEGVIGTQVVAPDNVAHSLAKWDQLKQDVAEASSIDELKDIRDKAEAIRLYAKKQKNALDIQNNAAEVTLRCTRRMGEMLPGIVKPGNPQLSHDGTDNTSHKEVKLSDIGITRNESSRCQTIAQLPEETFERHIAETKEKRKELTQAGLVKRAKQQDLVTKKAEIEAQAQAAPTKPLLIRASWENWLPKQPKCDLLITDPPYSTDIEDIETFANAWLPLALSKVKTTGRAYVCIGAYPQELRAYLNVKVPSDLRLLNILVWTYKNTLGPQPHNAYKLNWQAILYFIGLNAPHIDIPIMNEQFAVQEINAPDGRLGDRYHTWQKPDELAERLVRHSTKPGDTVIDCFSGTGTFLLAAHRLGRVAYGCERSEDMLRIAVQRGCEAVNERGSSQILT